MDRFGGLIGLLFIWLIAWSAKRMQEVGKAARKRQAAARQPETPVNEVPAPTAKRPAKEERLRDKSRADRLDPRTQGFEDFQSKEHQDVPVKRAGEKEARITPPRPVAAAKSSREVIPRVSASTVVQAIVAAEILNRSGPVLDRRKRNRGLN